MLIDANPKIHKDVVLYNINELITLKPLSLKPKPINIDIEDLGILKNAWIYVKNTQIADFGSGSIPKEYQKFETINLDGAYVMPSFVDCHTHPLYAGVRSHEFAIKLEGATYQQIANQGGGIKYTVKCTREASDQKLKELLIQRTKNFLQYGTTTCEIKTGYALSVKEELRHLRLIKECKEYIHQDFQVTCLALHAMSDDYPSKKDYIDDVVRNLLPKIKEENLAQYVDVFIEKGYYEPDEIIDYINIAKKLGLKIRVHADEFSDLCGAEYAAIWGAKSADHLEYTNPKSIQRMASSDITAVLLPGTSLYSKIKFANAKAFFEAKVPVAVASDYNPGSCQFYNMPFLATLAALYCNMNAAQAIASICYVPAYSLDLHHRKGALSQGYDADFVVYDDLKTYQDFIASCGQILPSQVWVRGKRYK